MNNKQKKLLLIALVLFELSILVVPQELRLILSGGDNMVPEAKFQGYVFIWNVMHEISIKHLLVEWAGIFIGFIGLFFYYKD